MIDVRYSPTPCESDRDVRTRTGGHSTDQDTSPQQVRHADQGPDHADLRDIVALARHSAQGCDLAGGILVLDSDVSVAEASEPLAAELDQLQRELGEGPGPLACRLSAVVSSDDLGADERWPSFSPQALRYGIAAVVAIPLLPERGNPSWRGWLTLYSRHPGPLPSASIAVVQTLGLYFSNAVTTTLHAKNLEAALASRDLIGQAKGIIMARRNIDGEQAFAILQQASQRTNRRLRDVAESVVRSCQGGVSGNHTGR